MSITTPVALYFYKAEKFAKKGLAGALPSHGHFPKGALPLVGDILRFHDVAYPDGELATFKITSRAFLSGSPSQPWEAELSLQLVETDKKTRHIVPVNSEVLEHAPA